MQQPHVGAGHFHAVRFYDNAESLARMVGQFLEEGFLTKQPAIVIATSRHRDAIANELQSRSFDLERLQRNGQLWLLDADAVLKQFMIDGMPDQRRFRGAIEPVIEKACGGRKDCVVRAYGEMVDVLWKQGHTVAAIRLETLWNQLAQTHAFSLLCGYSMGNFYKDAMQEEIRGEHTHVVSESGEPVRTQMVN